jgi:hypothetical protein
MDNTKKYGDMFIALLSRPLPNLGGVVRLSSLMCSLPSPSPPDSLSWLMRAMRPPAPAPAKPDGIWFDRNNGATVQFSEPTRLRSSLFGLSLAPLPGAGLYAVLVADGSATPRPFRALYFGESETIDKRASSSHEKYGDWCAAAGGEDKLYVAYCWMIGSTKDERTSVEAGLIERYHPVCNVVFNSLAWFLASIK